MIPLTLAEIAAVVGGAVALPPGATSVPVVEGAAYVDSRTPVPRGLYVAIAGERVDGHDFAAGAHAVLGARPTEAPTVVVDDAVVALGRLARHVVDRLAAGGLRTLALTGSQGKTGTKDLLAHVLAATGSADPRTGTTPGPGGTVATGGNHNNEIGVPLTVLRAETSTRDLVVEMGARGIGHIAYLCELAPPQAAAVLNVGTAHIGEFGSREAIAAAKGEIVEALDADGVAVLNADDPLVAPMAARTRARVLSFGRAGEVSWDRIELDELGRPSFDLLHAGRRHPVRLRTTGAHQVANAAAAAALALAVARDPEEVAAALSGAEAASASRMQLRTRADGLLVVDDAYNANPASMRAALEALIGLAGHRRGRSIAVLGEMFELGTQSDAGHREVGESAAALGVDVVVVVGPGAAGIAEGAGDIRSAGAEGPVIVVTAGRDEAWAWVRENVSPDDVVLVKASNGAALAPLARRLAEEPAPGPQGPAIDQEGPRTA